MVFTGLSSCKESVRLENTEFIYVNLEEKAAKGNFDDYFSTSKIIPLETKDGSIIGNIDRMSLYNDKIFILDKQSNSVLIFNNHGKFISKIQSLGKGPEEYDSLTDFAVDEEKEQIILYSDRPYKLLIYNFDGKFIEEKRLNNLYFNVGFANSKILLLNKYIKRKYLLFERELDSDDEKGFIRTNDKDKFFNDFGGMGTPNIIKNNNIHISFPYSEIVYEYSEDAIDPKYYIDFGKYKMPNEIYKKRKDYSSIIDYSKENNYGFGISNFRENDDYITFNFYYTMLVIYSKKTKKTERISLLINDEDSIPFYNYFAHDGGNNKLISIYPAPSFKRQMSTYKEEKEPWKKVPNNIKKIAEQISETDNPLLVVYTFKNEDFN